MNAVAEVERGRELCEAREWSAAYAALADADRETDLGADDLELLSTTAYMLGRQDEYYDVLGRAHRAHLNAGDGLSAARCALWIGMNLAQQGEMGQAGGWLARAHRLVKREEAPCVEQGYLLIPLMFEHEARGEMEAAIATAAEAGDIAERFGDDDLLALATHSQGHLLILDGQVREGLALLDESMVAVAGGELSPIVSGIVYCGLILACRAAFEIRRAQEWTKALASWCEKQPDMVAFTGRCLVHRSEILGLRGSWDEALHEAQRAARRCLEGQNRRAAGQAAYLEGEVHRLRGAFEAAEESYRKASELGREPQPGLALLRAAQGRAGDALASLRRAVSETNEPPERAALLPALVETALAAGELEAAHEACEELKRIATGFEGGAVPAMSDGARGAVALAAGEPEAALASLRRAVSAWAELDAPYEAARSRELIARACATLGDQDAAEMERDAARSAFTELGAAPDLARVIAEPPGGPPTTHGLTDRELEILRLVAAGQSNKAIASELVISERTVERHVSNVFAKLGVSSRAAATAFAYEHGLV